MMNWLKEFWLCWRNEIGFLMVTLALWLVSPLWISEIDARSGTYDQGILQIIFFTILQFAFYATAAWIFIRFTFKHVFLYFQTDFFTDYKNLETCAKLYFSVALFCYLLLVLTILSRVL